MKLHSHHKKLVHVQLSLNFLSKFFLSPLTHLPDIRPIMQMVCQSHVILVPGLPFGDANFNIDSIESRPSYGYDSLNDRWVMASVVRKWMPKVLRRKRGKSMTFI